MKKILISLLTFLRLRRNQETIPRDMEEKAPVINYEVWFDGEKLSTENNLLAVSKQYQELKRSTLYKAFAKEDNTSRTYEKNEYLVKECQKF